MGLAAEVPVPVPRRQHHQGGRVFADLERGPVGPRLRTPLPVERSYELPGRRIGLPIGMPAGVTTSTPEWIDYYAGNGFNVFTTRTFRTKASKGYGEPHFILTDSYPRHADLERLEATTIRISTETELELELELEPPRILDPTWAAINSYGIPSPEPDVWKELVRQMRRGLSEEKMLIVSVVGQSETGDGDEIVKDFVTAVTVAAEAEPDAIELNLSFPVDPRYGDDRPYCSDVDLTVRILEEVAIELVASPCRVVAKISHLGPERLAHLVPRIAPYVDGIAGVNAVPVKVVNQDYDDHFPHRAGKPRISGAPLREVTQDFVAQLSNLRRTGQHYYDILASGGVMTAADAVALRRLGADAVQSATGSLLNPLLAWDVHQVKRRFGVVPGDRAALQRSLRRRSLSPRFWQGGATYVPRSVLPSALRSTH